MTLPIMAALSDFAQGDRGVVGVLGLEFDAVAVTPEALDGGFFADPGGDDFAVLGGLLGLDDDQVARQDVRAGHALALDAQQKAVAPAAQEREGDRDEVLDVLGGEQGHAGGDGADQGQAQDAVVFVPGARVQAGQDADAARLPGRAVLAGQPLDEALLVQGVQVDGDAAQGADAQALLHLADGRRVALVLDIADDEVEDFLLPSVSPLAMRVRSLVVLASSGDGRIGRQWVPGLHQRRGLRGCGPRAISPAPPMRRVRADRRAPATGRRWPGRRTGAAVRKRPCVCIPSAIIPESGAGTQWRRGRPGPSHADLRQSSRSGAQATRLFVVGAGLPCLVLPIWAGDVRAIITHDRRHGAVAAVGAGAGQCWPGGRLERTEPETLMALTRLRSAASTGQAAAAWEMAEAAAAWRREVRAGRGADVLRPRGAGAGVEPARGGLPCGAVFRGGACKRLRPVRRDRWGCTGVRTRGPAGDAV